MFFSSEEKKKRFDDDDNGSSDEDSLSVPSGSLDAPPKHYARDDIIVCATKGKLYAVSKRDGSRIWRADFPSSGVVSVFITDMDQVIAGGNGKTVCYDLYNGKQRWMNNMKVNLLNEKRQAKSM